MAGKSGSRKKSGGTRHTADTAEKDRRIAELENRIAVLENELKSRAATPGKDVNGERAGEALRESEEMLSHIIDASPIPMVLYNEGKDYYFYNKRFHETFGYTIEDVPTINEWWLLAYPDDEYREYIKKRWYAAVEEAIRNKSSIVPQDAEVTCKDGSKRHILGEFTSIGSMNLSILYDVTERKRAEEALRESEAKFRALFEGAGVAIFVADVATGRLIDCNKKAGELTGRSRDEIIGLHQTQVHPAYRAEVQKEQFARHSRGIIHDNDEAEVLHRDGRVIPVIIKAAPLKVNGRDVLIGFFFDITERKRAEEALLESEASLIRAQAIAHIGNWEWDLLKGEGRWSDELYSIFGVDKKSFYPSQENFLSRVHPEDRPRVESAINATYREGKPYRLNFRIIRLDGSERTLYCEGELAYDKDGKPLKIFGINQDITERKRAEEGEKRLRALMDHNPSLVFMKDESGRYVYLNNAYEKQFVLSGNWFGKTDFNFWPKESAELFRANDAEVLRSGRTHQFIEDSTDLQGKRFCWLNYKFPFTDSNGNKYVGGIGIDVTDRIKAEEALQESKAQLEAVFSSMNDAIIIFDTDGKATSANYAAVQFHRFTRMDELLTSLNGYVELLDTRNMDGTPLTPDKWPINRALRGEIVFNQDLVITRRDTGESWVGNSSAAPIRDECGNVIAAVITMRDVTEQKRAEDALREAKTQAELYLDLMGHDINNMHQIAMGYLELIEGMLPDGDPRRELLEKPAEVLQRSAQLIKNVRKLQKLREGMFQTQDVDVCELLVDVQREFGSVPHKAITLNLNGCGHCRVRANELLHDVFANLVSNAIKHTGDWADINIGLGMVNDNGDRYCLVSVGDNGPGIPDDFKGVIFNRMLKGTNKAKGMGLGLYLVKSLVESYGGRVWVEDRVKGDHTKGARFVVMLPAV